MSYGRYPYGGVSYAGSDPEQIEAHATPILAVEVSFTTDALAEPVWVDISRDVRSWSTTRGRNRELERHQPGRATVVLDNRDRDYDSEHTAGPWFGNLRPMRRMRIRETFRETTYPVFDGYVDSWTLDYPATGKDATATLQATDGFKVLTRTELPRSVYVVEVEDDNPLVWWRLDEMTADTEARNTGSSLTAHTGTIQDGATAGQGSIVVNDPGGSLKSVPHPSAVGLHSGSVIAPTTLQLKDHPSWAVELWFRPESSITASSGLKILWDNFVDDGTVTASARLYALGVEGAQPTFVLVNTTPAVVGVEHSTLFEAGNTYHVVCKRGPGTALTIYINGVASTTIATDAGAVANTLTGALYAGTATFGALDVDPGFVAPQGLVSHVAVYTAAQAVDPLPDARITAHYEAGTAPWQNDLPGARATRVLDEADWPTSLRVLDTGVTTLQSAALGVTALEHLQKIGETEFGLLFMDRAGNVRFVERPNYFAPPGPFETFGEGAGEIGYREVVFEDGDTVIRNQATISRLNGVAQTVADAASVEEFGRFQYTLDGLLHRTDARSRDYAQTIVAEYGQPRRRVTSLRLGPADASSDINVAMLGRELGDAITVSLVPPGGGDPFEQICVIEGINRSGSPKILTATWMLSPRLGGVLPMDWTTYIPSNTNITVGNGTQTARFARSGNTVIATYTLTWGSTTSFGGDILVGLPVAAANNVVHYVGSARMLDTGTAHFAGTWRILPAGTSGNVAAADGTGDRLVDATNPFTWTTGDVLSVTIVYEAA